MNKHNGVVVVLLILIVYATIMFFKIDFIKTGIGFALLSVFTAFLYEKK